jgi:tetratricopeptide (TPR) repeat protein
MRDRPPALGSRWLALLLVGAGIAAYANSLGAAFVYDDWRWIESNPAIRHLDLAALVSDTSRPVWKLSLALNYAAGGLDVTGYHLVNVSIHLLAGLALFGLVHRTLLAPRQADRYARHASVLAFAVALLWLVHPLQTQAVTYVVQRAESGMGLCYLATLYFATRAAGDRWRAFFSSAAVCTCAVGMGVKEVMVTAPVLVWLHDRTFLAGSALGALRGRPLFYAALAATWLVPLLLIGTEALFAGEFARPDLARPSPLEYARSQPAVVLHYLRLAVWPHPLVFSYGWPVSDPAASVLPTLVLGALAAASGWALWRNRAVGFLGAWFFGILAPTSSIQPIQDLAFEHRMYLSLAAIVTLVVMGTYELLLRADLLRLRPIAAMLAAVALAAGIATARRNRDYRDEVTLWRTVVDAVPGHAVAHYNLGTLLRADGRGAEAIASLRRAVELDALLAVAHNNLGNALLESGDRAAAIHHYRAAVEADPEHAEAHVNLGGTLARAGDFAAAARHYRLALEARPDLAKAHYGLGVALAAGGDRTGAIDAYREALRHRPGHVSSHTNLGLALYAEGRLEEGESHLRFAARLAPSSAKVWNNLGVLLHARERLEEADAAYRRALAIDPDYAVAAANLGAVAEARSDLDEAIRLYRRSVALDPDYERAHVLLREALAQRGVEGPP